MDTKQKSAESRSTSRRVHDSSSVRKLFYEQAIRLTGFTEAKCREILVEAFGESFDREQIPAYLKLLKERAEDERGKSAIDDLRNKIRSRLQVVPEPNPCPVPGCGGVMVSGKPWHWTCSKGGLRHYLAEVLGRHQHIPIEVALLKLDNLYEIRQLELQNEHDEWERRMRLPYEIQAWQIYKEVDPATRGEETFQRENDPAVRY